MQTAESEVTAMDRGKERFIAVPVEDGMVFGHFGSAEHFNLYEIEKKRVKTVTSISHSSIKRGALVGMLKTLGVDTVICCAAGEGVRKLMTENDIEYLTGVSGNADEAVKKYLEGEL